MEILYKIQNGITGIWTISAKKKERKRPRGEKKAKILVKFKKDGYRFCVICENIRD